MLECQCQCSVSSKAGVRGATQLAKLTLARAWGVEEGGGGQLHNDTAESQEEMALSNKLAELKKVGCEGETQRESEREEGGFDNS